jgi:uncharacterized membrane protein YhaH (DUF805 family)
MGFGQAISYNLSNMTNFTGRAGRSEFWWWILAVYIINFVVSLVTGVGRYDNGFLAFVGSVIVILLWLTTLAVGCRRLHDTGKSGWLQLLLLIPCVGVIVLIVFWVQPTTPGENVYGPAPTS